MKKILSFFRDKRGVSSLEYVILAGIVIAGVSAVSPTLKTGISTAFTNITANLSTDTNAATNTTP